jgi:hypothetical protein
MVIHSLILFSFITGMFLNSRKLWFGEKCDRFNDEYSSRIYSVKIPFSFLFPCEIISFYKKIIVHTSPVYILCTAIFFNKGRFPFNPDRFYSIGSL